jgi:PAS domain S-box-containing protein
VAAGPVDDAAVLDALFGKQAQGLFVLDSQRNVVRYNPAGPGVRGLPPASVLGHSTEEFAPDFAPDEIRALVDEAFATGEPLRRRLVRGRSPSHPDRLLALEISLFPLRAPDDGVPRLMAVVEDVTERQAATDRLAVLSSVHAAVGSTLDEEATAGQLVRVLVPAFADAACVDLLDTGPARQAPPVPAGTPLCRLAAAPDGFDTAGRGASRPLPGPSPFSQALKDARARLVTVSDDAPWIAADPEGFAPLLRADVHSMIVAPLISREAVLGLLILLRHRADPFEEADLDVARQAASTASAHLDNCRSYQHERSVATALQRRLQPGTIPRLSAADTAHVYLPDGAGGDWFDVIGLSGARVALIVGEVYGHGIEAAATMGQLRIALRTLALQDLETDELMTRLDEVAALLAGGTPAPGPGGHVATCAMAVYSPVSGCCTVVRAGHPAPALLDPDGEPLPLEVEENPPLGAGGGRAFTPTTVQLAPGSLIGLYTNGLLAADRDPAAARHRLEHILAAPAGGNLQELCRTAVDRMAPPPRDDAVLLLARTRLLPREDVADWTLPADPSVVATARRLAGRQLAAWDLDDTSFSTELVISELVTNAIRHGEGPIRLRLIRDEDRLLTEVTDASSASPHPRHARDTDEGGRGLFLVTRLSSRWGVRHSRRDKTIWSEQGLGQDPAEGAAVTDTSDTNAGQP